MFNSTSKRFALIAAAFGALTMTSALIPAAQAQDKMMSGAKMNEKTVMVGGAPMYPSKNIIDNAVNSKDHTTLVAAVKAAGLVETLKGTGPFTVFAPTNAAFAKLPAGTVDTLLKPENKAKLTGVLTYHVVPGRLSAATRSRTSQGRLAAAPSEDGRRRQRSPSPAGSAQLTVTDAKGDVANGHHPRRHAVERRHPCGGHRSDPGELRPARRAWPSMAATPTIFPRGMIPSGHRSISWNR